MLNLQVFSRIIPTLIHPFNNSERGVVLWQNLWVRILSRYIFKEFCGNLILGLLIFTFVLLLDHLFELMDVLINKGGTVWLTLKLLALLLPATLEITLPVSVLLAALLTFGRFSETNEVTAIRASGLSAWSYLKTPYWMGLGLALFLIPFNSLWAPAAQSHFRELFLEVLGRNPLVRIEENTFVEIGDYHFFVRKKSRRSLMRGISIYKNTPNGPPLRIYADEGTAKIQRDRGVTFTLHHGHLEKIDPANPEHWLHTAFETYVLGIPFSTGIKTSDKALEEMDYFELRRRIKDLRAQHVAVPDFICQIHLRWALAVTPLLFVALGIPLAIRVQRGGRSIGFAISLGVIAIYYVLLMGGTGLGQRGAWPPIPAVWMANAVLLVAAGFFTLRFLKQ